VARGPVSAQGAGVEAGGPSQKSLATVDRLGGVGRRRSGGTDLAAAALRVQVGGGADAGGAVGGRMRAEAAPIAGGWLEVGVGGARVAQGGSVNGVSRCAAAMVDRAHAKKFSRSVRRGEGIKARRYANFTFVGDPHTFIG
jgi:hypothetical protein